MDTHFSVAEFEFQKDVREFLQQRLPQKLSFKVKNGRSLEKSDYVAWHKILFDKGWAGENWPINYGGTGWSATQKYIFSTECAMAGAPRLSPFGLKMVAPVIYMYGNEEQKSRFLPDILQANVWWCQGYSEPGAGSDLASLKTTAKRSGDEYVVNGTKTWTTHGHWADWIFCLVRTRDASHKPQSSISFLLIDLKTSGISISPIKLLDGGSEVNEVHFDDVRVPAENLIGDEGMGWTYAKLLLTHERTGIAQIQFSKERMQRLKQLASKEERGGAPLISNPIFSLRLAEIEIELMALEYTELRCLSSVVTGEAPGPESSILKLKGTEIMQAIDELFMEVAGVHSLAHVPGQFVEGFEGDSVGAWYAASTANHYFNNRKVSVYGGSNEIQKNIIAKTVLGL